MSIREIHDLPAAEQAAFKKANGDYNDFPPAWREIDAATFAKSRHFTWAPVLVEHRQMLRHPDGTPAERYVQARLEWQADNTGYALVADYWGGTVKFFAFGCEHKFGDARAELKRRNETLFSMQHAEFCTKCGWLGIYDSSD